MNSKTVNMMDLRQHIGALVSEVIYQQKQIIVKKHDKPVCVIMPYTENQTLPPPSQSSDRVARLKRLYGALHMSQEEIDYWQAERAAIERRHQKKLAQAWSKKK